MARNQDILFQGLTSLFFSINLREILLHCKKMWAREFSKIWQVLKSLTVWKFESLTTLANWKVWKFEKFETFQTFQVWTVWTFDSLNSLQVWKYGGNQQYKFQSFKLSNFSNFQNFKLFQISNFQTFKHSKFSNFQSFKLSKFEKSKNGVWTRVWKFEKFEKF